MLVALAGNSFEETCQGTPNSFIFLEWGLCFLVWTPSHISAPAGQQGPGKHLKIMAPAQTGSVGGYVNVCVKINTHTACRGKNIKNLINKSQFSFLATFTIVKSSTSFGDREAEGLSIKTGGCCHWFLLLEPFPSAAMRLEPWFLSACPCWEGWHSVSCGTDKLRQISTRWLCYFTTENLLILKIYIFSWINLISLQSGSSHKLNYVLCSQW